MVCAEKKLTDWQLKACSLVSPAMGRMTHSEAAREMGISTRKFNAVLERARKSRPDLFPMLTNQEHDLLNMLECGVCREDIATRTGLTVRRVDYIIESLRRKGRDVTVSNPGAVSYQSWMDDQVKEKF